MTEPRTEFWDRVDKSGECWVWLGGKGGFGYGRVRTESGYRVAHRVAWELTNGLIPDGLLVCHSCDNPPCVRPGHLFLGTIADNNHDRDVKGRAAPLTPERAREYGLRTRGEANGGAKLTRETVAAIRAEVGLSSRQVAGKYGISQTHALRLMRGESWK